MFAVARARVFVSEFWKIAEVTQPCDLTATEARRRIGEGSLKAGVLLESSIARVEMVNPAVNAIAASPGFLDL